jgi:hypothetical protein
MPVVPPPGWPPQPMSAPPGYPPPGYPMAGPPPRKSNTGLIVGIVVGVVVLLCVGGVVALVAVSRFAGNPSAAATQTTVPVITTPAPSPTTPDTGPTGDTFNMRLGDGVRVTATNGDQWGVQVLAAHWFPQSCNDLGSAPVLVVDVHFEVSQGTASLSSLTDFTYVDSDGNSVDTSGFTGCANPALTDTTDLPAGQSRDGQIDFQVPSGKGGILHYDDNLVPTGSWVITGP